LGTNEFEKLLMKTSLAGISKLVKDNEDVVTERISRKWEETKLAARNVTGDGPVVEFAAFDGL